MATAAPDYTVDGMVDDVKNTYISPTSQNLFQDSDVINHLDKAQRTKIIPLLNSVRDEYWVNILDQSVTGAASYTLPERSSGAMLRMVSFLDTSGNEIELTRLSPVQLTSTFPFGYQLPLYTYGYYLQDDQLFLFPAQAVNATQFTLRMRFLRRPNNLTSVDNCGKITSISGRTLTLDNVSSDWSTSTTFDIIQNFPQFNSASDGATISALSTVTNTITLSSLPSSSTDTAVPATGTVTIVNYANLLGGVTITINGVGLDGNFGGFDFTVATSNTFTAASLTTAINNNTSILGVSATSSGGTVTITSNTIGTGGNDITLATSDSTNAPVSGSTLSGGVGDMDNILVGMYVCPTLMSCIPQIPYEMYDLLISAGAARLARALGDSQGLQLAEKAFEEGSKDFIRLIDPRVQGSRKIISNRNSPFNFGSMGAPFLR